MVPFQQDFAKINIPILTTTGYFDDDQQGALYYYQQHYRWNKNPDHYLLIGPWDHSAGQSQGRPEILGHKLDSVAIMSVNDVVYQWFDHILRNGPMPDMLKDRVNFEVIGENRWESAASFDEMANDSKKLYLSPTYSGDGFQLWDHQPDKKQSISLVTDLTDRSNFSQAELTIVDTSIFTHGQLMYYTPPLKEDLVMAGSLKGNLEISLNKKDADLSIRLFEVTSDGNYFLLSYCMERLSFNGPGKRTLLKPNKKLIVPIKNSFVICKKMNKGSRLLLTVGINNSPDWEINYGSGKEVSRETIADAGEPMEIQFTNQSYIVIPLRR